MKEVSVGIDLGTTNSTISTCWPEGQPRLIRDEGGSGIIPSVVYFPENADVIVGHKARQYMLTDMENTLYSIKRFIGRDMRTDENKWISQQYPFNIETGPNGAPIATVRDKKFPIHQVSGFILEQLTAMAANSTGQEVKKAVITVPANFNESQRKATKQAGEFAGLEVLRIFNEPTAAALAYGLGKTEKEIVAIFDFGGGTFDITILRLEDPVFEVLATAGDMMLGGDDFDRLILQDMLEQFQDHYGFSPADDSSILQRFLFGAERMKCQLSDWIVTAFEDRHVKSPEGSQLKPFHYELNREKFKNITLKLGERSLDVCGEALRTAGVGTSDISQVVLVGGTTRVPFLRKMVEEFFGRPPLDKIQPDVVVSIGASIQAYSLAGGDIIYQAEEKDILPTISHKRILPRVKGAAPPDSDFDDRLDLSGEIKDEEEPSEEPEEIEEVEPIEEVEEAGPVEEPAPMPVPAPFDEGAKTKVRKPFDEKETQVRRSVPPPLPEETELRSSDFTSKDLDIDTVHQPPSQSLLDSLKKAPRPGDEVSDLTVPRETKDLLAAGLQSGASPAEEEPEEIPDIQVISSSRGTSPPIKKPLARALDNLEEQPQAVTPESLNEPYVPRDVLRQMDEIHRRELEEEEAEGEGEIASVGPVGTSFGGLPEATPKQPGAHAPLLLDVTPSTLGVATVGGYREIIIKKNSPVPIEKCHLFTTSADDQEKVVIRVLEGESNIADDNNELGVIELLDIRPAPRGTVKIEVTFDISVDGILEISAKNMETRKAQKAKLTLFGT